MNNRSKIAVVAVGICVAAIASVYNVGRSDNISTAHQTLVYACGYLDGESAMARAAGIPSAAPEIPAYCNTYKDAAIRDGFNPAKVAHGKD